jgi:hypothetical protein
MTAVMGIAGRYYRKIGISEKFLFFKAFQLKRCQTRGVQSGKLR